jgi:hypothetical protein
VGAGGPSDAGGRDSINSDVEWSFDGIAKLEADALEAQREKILAATAATGGEERVPAVAEETEVAEAAETADAAEVAVAAVAAVPVPAKEGAAVEIASVVEKETEFMEVDKAAHEAEAAVAVVTEPTTEGAAETTAEDEEEEAFYANALGDTLLVNDYEMPGAATETQDV